MDLNVLTSGKVCESLPIEYLAISKGCSYLALNSQWGYCSSVALMEFDDHLWWETHDWDIIYILLYYYYILLLICVEGNLVAVAVSNKGQIVHYLLLMIYIYIYIHSEGHS